MNPGPRQVPTSQASGYTSGASPSGMVKLMRLLRQFAGTTALLPQAIGPRFCASIRRVSDVDGLMAAPGVRGFRMGSSSAGQLEPVTGPGPAQPAVVGGDHDGAGVVGHGCLQLGDQQEGEAVCRVGQELYDG